MPRGLAAGVVVLTMSLLPACAVQETHDEAVSRSEPGGNAEEIYIFRTSRTRHERGATPACAPAPFSSANEDYYELWSIEVRPSDSRVVNAHRSSVGGFTACLGKLVVGQPVAMYAFGTVANVPWTGIGECLPLKSQPPVRTALALSCHLDLAGLPSSYAGGFLVSSTLAPLLGGNQPPDAHVPGYLSTSVVSVRLWKKKAGDPRS